MMRIPYRLESSRTVMCLAVRMIRSAARRMPHVAVLMIGLSNAAVCQALPGGSGLVSIPTATITADGGMTVGLNAIAAGHHGYYGRTFENDVARVSFLTVGFLPFAEVGLRLTHMSGGTPQAIGDRMVSFRIRLMKEGEYLPALAVGAQDIVGTRLFHATYAVASRSVRTPAGPAGLHLGYGFELPGVKVKGRQFEGLFGGASLSPHRRITLLAEHDGEAPNAGLRLGPLRGVAILVALQDFDGISGGVSYTFQLR